MIAEKNGFFINFLIVLVIGEGKRKNEFAEWHNYAKYEIWGTTQLSQQFYKSRSFFDVAD